MTYEEVVGKAKQAVKKIDTTAIKEHSAIEIDIEGEGEGAFYVELDNGKAVVEPYEYYDNDCRIRTDAATLADLLAGKLDAVAALSDGKLVVEGDMEKAVALASALKSAPAKKAAAPAKKPAAKKTTAKKPAEKKTTAKKNVTKK
ncbi:MAG: SCP2 sterol-binding domain-containing protein [Lachnospiraceae bacterium]|nr:SCP2 sterol-binding domain-containing protein [Lachnospiraceae bacterium]